MAKRKFWEKPILHFEEEINKHRKVTWLELFFDLYFVVVIAALTHILSADLSMQGVLSFVMTFIPVWWVWIGVTYYNERFETEGIENRVFTFLLMIPIAGLALFSHDAIGHNFTGFVLSYTLARIIITGLWAFGTYYNLEFRKAGKRYVLGFSISVILCVISVLVSHELGMIIFGVALVIDLVTPFFTIKASKTLPKFSTSKLPERFGLFVIIVLGEGVVGTINGISASDHIGTGVIYFGILGIAITFALWWIYFDFIGRRVADKNMLLKQFGWGYLHMPLVICFAAVGGSMMGLIGSKGDLSEDAKITLLVSSGMAIFIMGLIETLLEKKDDEPTQRHLSPIIKWVTGTALMSIAFFSVGIPSKMVMGIVILFCLINMIYGMYAWFSQEMDDQNIIDQVDIGSFESDS